MPSQNDIIKTMASILFILKKIKKAKATSPNFAGFEGILSIIFQ
jgi:hypothetical protein